MAFGTIISSTRGDLSPEQLLHLANFYLENARNESDPTVVLVLCYDAEVSLSHVKRSKYTDDQTTREGMAAVYAAFGELLDSHGHRQEAQAFYKKSEKWRPNRGHARESSQVTQSSKRNSTVPSIKGALIPTTATAVVIPSSLVPQNAPIQIKRGTDVANVPDNIFPRNMRLPPIEFKPPEPDTRLDSTPQLVFCLGLLQLDQDPNDMLDPVAQTWLQFVKNDQDEQDRLKILATGVIRAFKGDELKDAKAVTEVVQLAPVLDDDDYHHLLQEFYSGVEHSTLLDVHQLEGLAQLIQSAGTRQLDPDDLVKVLDLLSLRLRGTHQQSTNHLYQLTLSVSHVLDAMADAEVTGLNREKLHEPLLSYLESLKKSPDTYLVYQAAYAFQALLCVPDNESLWKATLRRTRKVIKGVSRLVSAVKGIDLNAFIDGLVDIHQGVAGAMEVVKVVKDTYDNVKSLGEGGKAFVDCLKEGLNFNRKCAWYTALRGADTLIQEGQFAEFKKLVCEAPCRRDPAFQWGVCQRLGELAVSPTWDGETRRGAIGFLGEMYKNDTEWGQQSTVKQWILNILMQLSTRSGSEMQYADSLLQDLRQNGDNKKQALYRACEEKGAGSHPLKVVMPPLGHPSLLDRLQERPDVEGHLRLQRRQRLKERGNTVYIPPQAKANLQALDDALFPLIEKVNEFLTGKQKVFLLLGDSGAGKSTFNRELECTLWQAYKKNGPIPLYISLPAIEKPEHDMIAKQLRKNEFTEPQIRELKMNREFILICDGYDESQQTHNLYVSNRLNQTGEWNAKMVISCRSEYVGSDYRDRFQPRDVNHRSEPWLFQEAVMTPFSLDQVQDYIDQFVSVHRPLWEAKEYKQALDQIPSLKDLVKNPFLMSLALEVLPRMVDPGQDISATQVTRVALYDHFIEHWLERGKKRLGEKNLSPQARAAFESLSDEGFTPNGIDFLKKLSVAIYKKQNGQPIVRYSRYKDEGSWKTEFFSRDEEKHLLREACPLTRSGNQHRFIHRSLLEYGLALAVFDPQDWKERMAQESMIVRRGSVDSSLSFMARDTEEESAAVNGQGPDINLPLVWRNFVGDSSILQFLEERVRQEPIFKQQLLAYIEHSKTDKKWRTAAANAITILVRAGIQFNHEDLRGVQIPGADISCGIFDSAQLQEADLRHVDLRGVWLRHANLSNAQMAGAVFGELPFLTTDRQVTMCAFSPDGKTLSVALLNFSIHAYTTSTWDKLSTMEGHTKVISSIVYSSMNNQLASSSGDNTVRLWNVETGFCLHVLNGHSDWVQSIAYSLGGDQIASAGNDKTLRLWDVESGTCLLSLTGHTGTVYCVAYAPDGRQLVSSSDDTTIRLWDIETKECSHILSGHEREVRRVTYSPQGHQLASGGKDTTLRLWDVTTGDCLHVLTGHTDVVMFILYSSKGDKIASSSNHMYDKTIRLWDSITGTCLHVLSGHTSSINSVAYSPQGNLIASASDDKTVLLWDTETGICRQTLTGHTEWVKAVAFSPKNDQVASCGDDRTVRLWDLGAGTSRHVSSGHSDWVRRVQYSPSGREVATCSHDLTARIWDVETGLCRHVFRGHTNTVISIAFSPHGNQIATGSRDSTVRLWNVETGVCIHTLADHTEDVNRVTFSPEGDQLASVSDDKTIRLWDPDTGECRHVLSDHGDTVFTVTYSPTGDLLASGCYDGSVRLWDTETGICLRVLEGHDNRITCTLYSPQSDLVVSASDDETVRVWDAATGDCQHVFEDHSGKLLALAYSPKGDQIAYGCNEGIAMLSDVVSGICLHTLEGHDGEIESIAYSPRGDLVVTASEDKTVRLWCVESGQCRAVIEDFQDKVNDVAWSESSGRLYVAACCDDGFVGMWQVIVEGEHIQANLRWRTTKGELTVKDTLIQDAQGLSQLTRQVLRQREAVGEPADMLREAGRKVALMASALSKLQKAGTGAMEDLSGDDDPSNVQLEQVENGKEP